MRSVHSHMVHEDTAMTTEAEGLPSRDPDSVQLQKTGAATAAQH